MSLLLYKSKINQIRKRPFLITSLVFIIFFSMNASFFVYAENDIDAMVEAVQAADEQLKEISRERFEIDQKITAINAEIPSIQAKNDELCQKLNESQAGMEERLRVMYMYNTDDMLQLLFSATSFSEFISRADLIASVYRLDRKHLEALQNIQNEIIKNEQQLQNDLNQLNESKNALVEKEIEMADICAERQAKLQDAQVAAAYEEATKAANQKEEAQRLASSDHNTSSSDSSSSGRTESSSNSGTTSGNTSAEFSDSDFDVICAIVRHEGGASYEGSLAVITCVMNRVDVGWGGNDALSVLTAPYQFESYTAGYYKQYLGADIPETRRAVNDCMYGGIRSHNFLSFRGYETEGSVNICGNWYFNPMN